MNSFHRRIARGFLSLAVACAAIPAYSQPYPAKPIRVVVPFGPGSGSDIMTRTLMKDLNDALGVPIIIENKPGAIGALAAEYVSKAPPDGYTLLMGTSGAHSSVKWLFKKVNYEPIADFTPIARTSNFPHALAVSGASEVKDLPQFLEMVRGPVPKTMGFGNSMGQIGGAHVMQAAGFKAVSVRYRSNPQALADLLGGQVDFMIVDLASSRPLVDAGKVRLLATVTDRRSSIKPELPALGETFPGFTYSSWGGLFGLAGLPPEVVGKLSDAVVKALNNPELKGKFAALGIETFPAGAAEFGKFLIEQEAAWGERIKGAGIEPE